MRSNSSGLREELLIVIGQLLCVVVVLDVKLGDHDLAADGSELRHSVAVTLDGGVAGQLQMRLHADAVQPALFVQVLAKLVHGFKLTVVVLVVVVVGKHAALGLILIGIFECLVDIGVVAVDADPAGLVGAAHAGRVGVGEGLVAHVEGVELQIGVLGGQQLEVVLDVAFKTLVHDLLADGGAVVLEVLVEEPTRGLAVPCEHMAAHRDVVLAAEVEDGAGIVGQADLDGDVVAGSLGSGLVQDLLRFLGEHPIPVLFLVQEGCKLD